MAKRALKQLRTMAPDTQYMTPPPSSLIGLGTCPEWHGVADHSQIPTATGYYAQEEEAEAVWAAAVAADGHDPEALVISGDDTDPAVNPLEPRMGRSKTVRMGLDYLRNDDLDHFMLGTDGTAKCRLMNTTIDFKGALVGRREEDNDMVLWDDAWLEKTFWIVTTRAPFPQDQYVTNPPTNAFVFSHEGTSGFVEDKAAVRYRIKKIKTIRFTRDQPYKHIRIRIKWPRNKTHEYRAATHAATAYYPPNLGVRSWLFIKTSYQYRDATVLPAPHPATWTTTREHMQMRTSFKQIPG